ncbi:MAG: enoyl-CoA hydratase/isomerase family protein [Gammaproteobacteria bacterium]|nr:enoyl-CoA hydratase/isomerase family protein [Gammaproteobacteria bacterium]
MNAPADPEDLVLLSVANGVATVTLNRPDRHNSLVPDILRNLIALFEQLDGRSDVRVVVLRAAGSSFSTGGDIGEFHTRRDTIEGYADELLHQLNQAITTIIECRNPVIVAVDGQVSGGSLGLVLGGDIIVVTERASFTPYYVDVGFSPDGGWTAILPEIIGRGRAAAVQLLNETISAQQALDWGIAHKMADSSDLDHTLDDICARIIAKKSGSIRATKRLLRRLDWRDQLENERRAFVKKISSPEALDGIDDFVARRT